MKLAETRDKFLKTQYKSKVLPMVHPTSCLLALGEWQQLLVTLWGIKWVNKCEWMNG